MRQVQREHVSTFTQPLSTFRDRLSLCAGRRVVRLLRSSALFFRRAIVTRTSLRSSRLVVFSNLVLTAGLSLRIGSAFTQESWLSILSSVRFQDLFFLCLIFAGFALCNELRLFHVAEARGARKS